ncbi:MAG: glycosyltransferase family 2 protein [Muribaculaceae bacterium]
MVSVIIPVYNTEKYLRQCLDSVLAQTYSDWEAILVDDGSTDTSGAICDEYAATDNRFKVLHTANAGVSAARNTAVGLANGKWLTVVDADDMLAPDALELWMKEARTSGCLCVTARFSRKAEAVMQKHGLTRTKIYNWEKLTTRSLHQLKGTDTSSCGKLLHRTLFDDGLRWPEGSRFEDLALLPLLYERAGALGSKVASMGTPLYYYRPVPGSFMDNPCSQAYADLFAVTEKIEDWAADKSSAIRRAARNRRFAAACALVPYALTANNESVRAEILWNIARDRRTEILFTPVTRLKTRTAAALTLAGRTFWQRAMTHYLTK